MLQILIDQKEPFLIKKNTASFCDDIIYFSDSTY